MWSYLARTGVEANVAKAHRLQDLSDRAEATLRALDEEMQRDHGIGLGVARSEDALTIRFRRLSDALVARYSLASDRAELLIDGRRERIDASHIFIMDHVPESLVDHLVADVRAAGADAVPPPSTVPAPVHSSGAGHAFGNVGGGFQE